MKICWDNLEKLRLVKSGKYLGEATVIQKIENHIRDHLSGTPRKTTKKGMWSFVKDNIKGSKQSDFNKAWKDLVDDDFLIKAGKDTYKWEM